MKKFLTAILSLVLLTMLFPATVSAVSYDSAKDGDLLYTVNFNGDSNFAPTLQGGSVTVTVDPLNSNKALFDTTTDKQQNRWGGEITGLPLGLNNAYTIKWSEIRENSIDGAIGVNIDNVYGTYGYIYQHRIVKSGSGIGTHAYINYATAGISPKATASDGTAQEYALQVNAQNKTIAAYILDSNNVWQLIDKSEEGEIPYFERENLGFYTYTYYASKQVTLTDVAIYKGLTITNEVLPHVEETTAPETTTPITTKAPDTTKKPSTTVAPGTTVAPSTEKAPKKGCGSSSVIIGLAQVVTVIGGSAIIIAVKKKV